MQDTFHPARKYVAIKILHTSYSSLGPQVTHRDKLRHNILQYINYD